jgi:gamma-glutamyltranspeptidase/glutathione hydrolase
MLPRFSVATQDTLRKMGHLGLGEAGTDSCKETIGSVQAVSIETATGARHGAADPRREGTVIQVKPAIRP